MRDRSRLWEDSYNRLAVLSLIIAVCLVLLESFVPNSERLQVKAGDSSLTDFMPAHLTWRKEDLLIEGSTWAVFLFSYANLLLLALLTGLLLFIWNVVSHRRCSSLQAEIDRVDEPSTGKSVTGEFIRNRLRLETDKKRALVEPLIGAHFTGLVIWLIATVVAAKIDPQWSRPFLPPPMLVAQNLQYFGGEFLIAMLRSSWHMLQGLIFGCVAGVALGFLLSNVNWLRKWTAWHVTVLSALPPFLLAEVFRQLVRHPAVPIFGVHNELAFKLAVSMASWAVMWPVLTATAHALGSIDSEYRRSVRLLGAKSTWERIRHLELPVIAHPVLANLRVGFVIGLIVLLYGEGYGPPRDYPTLGFWFSDITSNFKLQVLAALIVFTSLLVVAVELGLRWVERNLFPTRRPNVRIPSVLELRPSVAEERRSCLERFERARKERWQEPPWRVMQWSQEAFRMSGISKTFGGKEAFSVPGQEQVVLSIGEFLSVIGPSGAGKSTFLKLLLGFEEPDKIAGSTLELGNLDILNDRKDLNDRLEMIVSYVSQRPQLLPHKTVAANIFFGIQHQLSHVQGSITPTEVKEFYQDYLCWMLGLGSVDQLRNFQWTWPSDEKTDQRIVDSPLGLLARFMGLDDKMNNYPAELSGGEAQRTHLLRWVVLGRPLLIMDEAFSALDQPLKGMVRDAIQRHAKALGISVVNVSHDRADVLQVSDRILFINDHTVSDHGTPRTLYYSPTTSDLAMFLGHTNIFEISYVDQAEKSALIAKDIYRESSFDPPQRLEFDNGLERVHIQRTKACQLKNDCRNDRPTMFIPRSNVNLVSFYFPSDEEPERDAMKGFRVDSMRFTGTHFEIHWLKDTSSGQLRIESVIQDDDLQRKKDEAGIFGESLDGIEAHISIGRGVLLS